MQTKVYTKPDKYALGQCYSYRNRAVDLGAAENIPFGRGAVYGSKNREGRMPGVNQIVSTLSADLVSGGSFAGVFNVIDIAGNVTEGDISVAFSSDQATTAPLIKNAIEAIDSDIDVAISGSNRVFTITVGADKRLELVTPFARVGTGSATVANAKSTLDVQAGIAERDENAAAVLDTTYTPPVLKSGQMFAAVAHGDPAVVAHTATAIKTGDPVYMLLENYTDTDSALNERGTFRNDTDGGLAPVALMTGAYFSGQLDAGLAPVSLNK